MVATMIAGVFKGNGRLELEQRPVPKIERDDDIILEVGAVAICGSDLHMLDVPPKHPAKPGVILGHEFSGRVTDVGKSVRQVKSGDHVAIDPNPPCGVCEYCRSGLPNACLTLFENEFAPGFPMTPGVFWDGGYAQYVRVPAHYVYRIEKHVPFWQASMLEPLGCVVNSMNKANFRIGESAVVLGAGPIGLLFVSMLKVGGASKIIVAEPATRRAIAARECGADVVVDPTKEDTKDQVMAETKGKGADLVIEAVGWLLPLATQLVRMSGRIILFGIDTTASSQISPTRIVVNEVQIFGGFLMKYSMPSAIRILEAGLLPIDQIVSHKLPLEELHEGIGLIRRGDGIKIMLIPNKI